MKWCFVSTLIPLARKDVYKRQLLCSTNQRSLSVADFRELVTRGLKNPSRWKIESAPMPADFTGEKYLKALWLSEREETARR